MFGRRDNVDEYDLSPSLRRKFEKLEGLLSWPSITDGLETFKGFVKDLAREVVDPQAKQLRNELSALRTEHQLLLDHLGLEVVTVGTKEIRKKVAKKGKK